MQVRCALGIGVAASALLLASWARRLKKRKQKDRPWLHRSPQRFYPFAPAKGIMNLRLIKDEAAWLDVDRDYSLQLELKRVLLSTRPADVMASLNDARVTIAGEETLQLILEEIQDRFPDLVRATESKVINLVTGQTFNRGTGEDALLIAAQLVQEDLAVLVPHDDTFILGQGVICFADRWSLSEKLGRTLRQIHDPVEHYPPIAKAVESFFRGLRVAHGVRIRYNYTFQNCAMLHLPQDCEAGGQSLYMRVERQGLRALPSGAVLFSIRTYLMPVAEIPKHVHAELRAALSGRAKTSLGKNVIEEYAGAVLSQLPAQ